MSSSLFIVTNVEEEERFDLPILLEFLRGCPFIKNLRDAAIESMLLDGDFFDDDEEIEFSVHRGENCVSMDDRGLISAKFCFLMQQSYPAPLYIFDEGFTFQLCVEGFRDPESLFDAILKAPNQD